jgi:hypothetical protein
MRRTARVSVPASDKELDMAQVMCGCECERAIPDSTMLALYSRFGYGASAQMQVNLQEILCPRLLAAIDYPVGCPRAA